MFVYYYTSRLAPSRFIVDVFVGDTTHYPSECIWMVPGTVDPRDD